jgi:peptide-methionine (S)-S-oxide reductase
MPGVWSTAVGYCNGRTAKPTYNQVCSGRTGHAEVVQVVYDPAVCAFADLLRTFWESHDPTQGDGQGNDRGSQYRSGIYCHDPIQRRLAEASRDGYQSMLDRRITTEILGSGTPDDPPPVFFFAEEYHQQYLARPGSRPYCSAQPTGHKLDPWGVWMPKDLTQEYSPKLPAAFWAKHSSRKGCSVVRASDEQVTLASLGAS